MGVIKSGLGDLREQLKQKKNQKENRRFVRAFLLENAVGKGKGNENMGVIRVEYYVKSPRRSERETNPNVKIDENSKRNLYRIINAEAGRTNKQQTKEMGSDNKHKKKSISSGSREGQRILHV